MRISADQIVNKLLEYGLEDYEQRPGGSKDPWRQSTGPLKPMQFLPRPPGLGAPAGEPASEVLPPKDDALDTLLEPPARPQEIPIQPSKRPMRPAVNPRFKWLPPTEPPPGP